MFLIGTLGTLSSILGLFCAVEINEKQLLKWASLFISIIYLSFIFKPENTENLIIICFFIIANLIGRGFV